MINVNILKVANNNKSIFYLKLDFLIFFDFINNLLNILRLVGVRIDPIYLVFFINFLFLVILKYGNSKLHRSHLFLAFVRTAQLL